MKTKQGLCNIFSLRDRLTSALKTLRRPLLLFLLFIVLTISSLDQNCRTQTTTIFSYFNAVSHEVVEQEDDRHYRFFDLHRGFGKFDLHRSSEITKEEFEVLLLRSIPRGLRKKVVKYLPTAMSIAEKYQVDPFWVMAIMWTESHFNHRARSYVMASGLMQIMPRTGMFLAEIMENRPPSRSEIRHKIWDPKSNIEMGVFYMRRLLKEFNNNYRLATMAYNMGPARVRWRIRKKLQVGVNNRYLNRVWAAYKSVSRGFRFHIKRSPNPYKATLVIQEKIKKVADDAIELVESDIKKLNLPPMDLSNYPSVSLVQ